MFGFGHCRLLIIENNLLLSVEELNLRLNIVCYNFPPIVKLSVEKKQKPLTSDILVLKIVF